MSRNENKIILHLCADIGSDSKPYENAGYDVIRIGKEIGVEKFHPPPTCTALSQIRHVQNFLLQEPIQRIRGTLERGWK